MTDPLQGLDLNPSKEIVQSNAVSADQTNQLSSLARVIGETNKNEISAKMVKGVITAVNLTASPPNCSAYINGDTSTAVNGIVMLDSYSPVVGDTVVMLAQGAEITIIGQYNDTGTGTANGWVEPTLASGVTTNSIDPLKYRVVVDNGDRKVQLRGAVNLSGSQTLIWTMPSGLRPLLNLAPIFIARDYQGTSFGVILDVKADGTMSIRGGLNGIDTIQTGIGGGSAVTSTSGVNYDHEHKFLNLEFGSVDAYRNADCRVHNGVVSSHNHVGGNHQHPFIAIPYPDSLSFNNISYYL